MKEFDDQLDHLLDRMRAGKATEREVREMERLLRSDPELRQRYLARIWIEEELSALFRNPTDLTLPFDLPERRSRQFPLRWVGAIAAGIAALLVVGSLLHQGLPSTVAKLESRSGDSWSRPPVLDADSRIAPGEIRLEAGTARLRFDSGAIVTLEGPASLVIVSAMRAKLLSGKALIEAPDSAHGFAITLPHGETVDLGTRFSVEVNEQNATCEVLEGRIMMRHESSQQVEYLTQGQGMAMTSDGIQSLDYLPSANFAPDDTRRVTLKASAETTVVSAPTRERYVDDRFLLVKMEPDSYAQRRVLFRVDLSEIKDRKLETARLNLNLVPSGLGFAAYLPDVVSFAVYGITDESRERWTSEGLKWEAAPGFVADGEDQVNPTEATLLGTFSIPSGQQRGACVIETGALLDFLRQDTTRTAAFLVVRETYGTREQSLVHAFATSLHPEASGPSLEVVLEK